MVNELHLIQEIANVGRHKDLDILINSRNFYAIHSVLKNGRSKDIDIYIDGLILTNKTLMRLIYEEIEPLKDYFSLEDINIKLHIVYFKENRKQCLINDEYRMLHGKRTMNAEHSIKMMKFEYPDLSLFGDYDVDLIEMDVYNCNLD